MKSLPLIFALWSAVVGSTPGFGQKNTKTSIPQERYLALDVHHFGSFHRYRYLEGDEIIFKANGDRYRAPLVAVTDSSFSISVQNEIMDRMEAQTFRFSEVHRIYRRKQIPFISQLGVILPIAGVTYAAADFINPKFLDGQTGRFLDPQTLIPAGSMIVAGVLFYKLTRPTYAVGRKNRLRAF